MPTRSILAGIGAYLPARIVSNDELARTVDTTDAWIRERTGITQRHFAAKHETAAFMGAEAARAGASPARGCLRSFSCALIADEAELLVEDEGGAEEDEEEEDEEAAAAVVAPSTIAAAALSASSPDSIEKRRATASSAARAAEAVVAREGEAGGSLLCCLLLPWEPLRAAVLETAFEGAATGSSNRRSGKFR